MGKHSKEKHEGNAAQKVVQLNKLNCAKRQDKDWPSGKAHEIMTQLVNSLSAKSVPAGEKLVATYSISS